MPSPSSVSKGDKIRQMISQLSTDDIARLIPQQKLNQLLRAQTESERAPEPAITPGSTNSAYQLLMAQTESKRTGEPTIAPSLTISGNRSKKKVNGFMAFRSYYAGIFQDRPQKERSPFVTTLWQTDTFKTRWTIMANVFSRVRDFASTTKGRMAMSGFLRVACPLMGIIKPADYLQTFNWELVSSVNSEISGRQYTLQQGVIPALVDEVNIPTTELELLRACVQGGFPFKNSAQLLREMEESSLNIIAHTAPPKAVAQVSRAQVNQQYIDSVINDPAGAIAALLPHEDTANLIVDINILGAYNVQHHSPRSTHHSSSSLENEMLFREQSIDTAKLISFPGDEHRARATSFHYPNPNLGLW